MGHLGLGCFQPGPQLVEGWRWVNELRVARLHIYVTKVNVITPSNSAPGCKTSVDYLNDPHMHV